MVGVGHAYEDLRCERDLRWNMKLWSIWNSNEFSEAKF